MFFLTAILKKDFCDVIFRLINCLQISLGSIKQSCAKPTLVFLLQQKLPDISVKHVSVQELHVTQYHVILTKIHL